MQWLMVAADGQQYSVAEADIPAMVSRGQIGPQTPLWRDGMSEWIQAGHLFPQLFAAQASAPTQPMVRTPQAAARPAATAPQPVAAAQPQGPRTQPRGGKTGPITQTATATAAPAKAMPVDAPAVKFIAAALAGNSGWIKFCAFMIILGGVFSLLPAGWLLIWAGVCVFGAAKQAAIAEATGERELLADSLANLARHFKLMAIAAIVNLVIFGIFIMLFLSTILAAVKQAQERASSSQPGLHEIPTTL